MLAERDRDDGALKAAPAKAEQLGTTNFYTLYRLAMPNCRRTPTLRSAGRGWR